MMLLLLACTGGEDSAPPADPCDEVPVVTYNNFGEGFLLHNCNGCHGAESPDRYGAPEGVHFDTVEQAWTWSARILERAGSEVPDMPPRGGVSDDDRERLNWWLNCAVSGT